MGEKWEISCCTWHPEPEPQDPLTYCTHHCSSALHSELLPFTYTVLVVDYVCSTSSLELSCCYTTSIHHIHHLPRRGLQFRQSRRVFRVCILASSHSFDKFSDLELYFQRYVLYISRDDICIQRIAIRFGQHCFCS